MHKTEHYGLSQWELEDQIKMEDFNSDNAKLDAALSALAGDGASLVPLYRQSIDSESVGIAFALDKYVKDWHEWSVLILVRPAKPSEKKPAETMNVRFDGDYLNVATFPVSDTIIFLFPMQTPEFKARAMILTNSGIYSIASDLTYEELTLVWTEGIGTSMLYTFGGAVYGIR